MRVVKRRDGRLTEEILMLEEGEREGSFHVRAGHRERSSKQVAGLLLLSL